MLPSGSRIARRFQLVLIKPSHYDDDGYVIQWAYSCIPSNSLAVTYSLAVDAASRQVLGPDIAIDVTPIDEANTRVQIRDILALLRRHSGFGMVGLVGVQSNQYPRALDIARPLRAANVPVVIGGFHVSGCLAMLPDNEPDLQTALDLGISIFAGEAESRFDDVLRDAARGALRPVYNHIDDLVALEGTPKPILPRKNLKRVLKAFSSFDAGRGCPYQCSFCTIINVQGRKSRWRSPDDIEHLIKENCAQGVKGFFITDDNFARNKSWEAIFDRIIELRERERLDIYFTIQVDTLCHKIPNFIEKAARAGVNFVFIGLENINPENLLAANKRQNKITEYRKMLLAWKKVGIITTAGYILGFPADTPDSIRESIEIIKKELPIDIVEFFCLTPLPGSEDHKTMWQRGDWMDVDMNKYDLEHVVAKHFSMSGQQWSAIYHAAWGLYYTREHIVTVLRRARASRMNLPWLIELLTVFSMGVAVEKIHPLQGGIMRRKYRADRRPGLPIEAPWLFYPRYAAETVSKVARLSTRWILIYLLALRVLCERGGRSYADQALTPVADDETETLDLFTHSASARQAVEHSRKIAALTHAPDLKVLASQQSRLQTSNPAPH
jgi:hypothetical protein